MAIDTNAYKTALEAELAQVTSELETIGIHNPENPSDWIATPEDDEGGEADPNIAADRVEDWDERAATLAQLERRYNDIKRALKKIDMGTYGVCEISGGAIETDRLDANPSARTCKAHLNEEATLPQ